MSKKILGLLLALCLVIGLLPLATFAEANPAKIAFTYAESWAALTKLEVASGSTTYLKTNDSKKLVKGSETDWCVKFEYPAEGAATLTMKNMDVSSVVGLLVGTYKAGALAVSGVACEVPINVVLEGTNKIKTTHANLGALDFYTKGDVTFSGNGTLEVEGNRASIDFGNIHASGNLIFDNVNVTLNSPDTYQYADGIVAEKNITVKGGVLNVKSVEIAGNGNSNNETFKVGIQAKDGNITIQDGAKVNVQVHAYTNVLKASGNIVIKDSDVEVFAQRAAIFAANNLTLNYAGAYKVTTSTAGCTLTDGNLVAKNTTEVDGTAFDASDITSLMYFKVAHVCAAGADDGDCTTATVCGTCGKEMAAAQTAHNLPTDDGDCTTAVKCQNAGCEYVSVEAKAAHVAGADDGDCTTAVACTNPGCTKNAVEAKQHTPGTRTDCSVAANCNVCGKEAIPAGQHGGGTATCKAKAKCATCGKEYGELGACAPAADDGDCTTAIKCTVCGKETTPAKTAHAYTNDKDTTCDNAGCTKTRELTGTNGSPATGDSMNLPLWISLLAVSVLGFGAVLFLGKKKTA